MEKLPRGFPDTRESRDKTRFARLTRSIINAIALALGLLLAYLQIKDIRPDILLTSSSADIIKTGISRSVLSAVMRWST